MTEVKTGKKIRMGWSLRILFLCGLAWAVKGDFKDTALEMHNSYRAIHNAGAMELNSDMNRGAAQYARVLFNRGRRAPLQHSAKKSRPGQGENLAMGCTTARNVPGRTVEDGVKAWYDEVCQYDFNFHGYQRGLGHFSQMVWKASSELGIGKYTGREGRWTCTYIVARYKTAGNVNSRSYFRENVEKGSFRKSYCNSVGDNAMDESEVIDLEDLTEK